MDIIGDNNQNATDVRQWSSLLNSLIALVTPGNIVRNKTLTIKWVGILAVLLLSHAALTS